MSALLALALAAAPGCPGALAEATRLPADALAARAPALAAALEEAGSGPAGALERSAALLAGAGPDARDAAAARFRDDLARHCALAEARRGPDATAADRAALAGILANPELVAARTDPDALRRALARLWDWLVEALGTEQAESYASVGRALFLGVAAAAGALAIAAARRRRAAAAVEPAAPGAAAHAGAPLEEGTARAEQALRRGETTEAVRLAMLAALAALEREGSIPRGRALTNEEVMRTLGVGLANATSTSTSTPTPTPTSTEGSDPFVLSGASPQATRSRRTNPDAIHADLALLVRTFDRAVYGAQPVAADEARGAVERARRIAAAAGATA